MVVIHRRSYYRHFACGLNNQEFFVKLRCPCTATHLALVVCVLDCVFVRFSCIRTCVRMLVSRSARRLVHTRKDVSCGVCASSGFCFAMPVIFWAALLHLPCEADDFPVLLGMELQVVYFIWCIRSFWSAVFIGIPGFSALEIAVSSVLCLFVLCSVISCLCALGTCIVLFGSVSRFVPCVL